MTTQIDDGGPAFPVTDSFSAPDPDTKVVHCRSVGGLTVRDYFAAQVAASVLSGYLTKECDAVDTEIVSKVAYMMADGMLAERAK